MKKVTERNLKVDYYEKEGEPQVWIAESYLSDEQHDITLILEIDMVQMKIIDTKIKFTRFPVSYCTMIEENAAKLNGLPIDSQFIRNAMKIFMGPCGCPNIMTLLNISVPGIIYYYYPYRIKTGEFKQEQWDTIIRTELKDACFAHVMLTKAQ
ncbi:MAG: hypothetical protein K0R50_2843 [Eubacterium sp.]|jgi:hypothetical protein|nr:hypothetical protein [Eubacterium sp.]